MQKDQDNQYFQLAARFVLHTNQNLFLTGKAGTGKTTFLKHIKDKASKKMAVVAPTGVAAINAGGVTIHSFFNLPLGSFIPGPYLPVGSDQQFNNRQTLLRHMRFNQSRRELIRELELLVIDEVSMVRADLLDAMDAVLRNVRKQPYLPFGGVQVVFIGDLYQLPPVVNEREWSVLQEYYKSPFFFDAKVLQDAKPIYLELKKIYRQSEQQFIDLLNKVRNNQVGPSDLNWLNSRFRPGFRPERTDQYITLTTHNHKAEHINQQALAHLPGKLWVFEAEITGEFNEKAYPAEPSLVLKEGAQVMFIRNDKGEDRRYFNGKIGTIHSITDQGIKVKFKDEAELLDLARETWKQIRYHYNKGSDKIEEEELGTFSQYPIRLAWAITIHKSQGLTFDKAIIDAGAAFAAGQVYVALSRLTTMEGMILLSRIEPSAIQTDERILGFSSTELRPEQLEEALVDGEQHYIQQSILKCFELDKQVEEARTMVASLEEKAMPEKEKAEQWAALNLDKTEDLERLAQKTIQHLDHLLKGAQAMGYQYLHERTAAAAGYFVDAIQVLLDLLRSHQEEMRGLPRVKKYLAGVALLELSLLRKLEEVRKAALITGELLEGRSRTSLLELIDSRPELSQEQIKDSAALQEANSDAEAKEKAKPGKGDSQRISLAMIRNGLTPGEIAVQRGLALSTIMGHLIGMVRTGELELSALVPEGKYHRIKETIESNQTTQLTPIKEQLGEEYSYEEIRAVIAGLEWENKKAAQPAGE
ncbi:helix-turn-helix domain-containing protein [Flavihumibacter rivuli]|uniref:helix-turn-helix domain-containing protein n=1 Tax=Flavihumibacter rivuli TaxID=2838156 RepID=UPI001BDDD533|nr:helix-turn-helix domain-containing protein [Flavihumibacter rivuli]ULQ55685.1 helix-turn-helix domain-containing protein [Flavihumibacter rivuli]